MSSTGGDRGSLQSTAPNEGLGASGRTSKSEGGELDLDAIRARAEAATAGPWHPATTGIEQGDHWSVIEYPTMTHVCHIPSQDGENEAQRRPDAEFIAYAREDVPALLAEVERLARAMGRSRVDLANANAALGRDLELQVKGRRADNEALIGERDQLADVVERVRVYLDTEFRAIPEVARYAAGVEAALDGGGE